MNLISQIRSTSSVADEHELYVCTKDPSAYVESKKTMFVCEPAANPPTARISILKT